MQALGEYKEKTSDGFLRKIHSMKNFRNNYKKLLKCYIYLWKQIMREKFDSWSQEQYNTIDEHGYIFKSLGV